MNPIYRPKIHALQEIFHSKSIKAAVYETRKDPWSFFLQESFLKDRSWEAWIYFPLMISLCFSAISFRK
jgi:hypothetical protein